MNDTDQLDVLIAVYLIPELARSDFDALADRVKGDEVSAQGIVLVNKDPQGEVTVVETGDHLGRKGATVGGGVGLAVGLFAPPLLAATAVGAGIGGVAGKFARRRLKAGIGEKLDDALPPGSAGIIAVYDHAQADSVGGTLANAIRSSIAQIDKASAEELKSGLQEAGAGLAGG